MIFASVAKKYNLYFFSCKISISLLASNKLARLSTKCPGFPVDGGPTVVSCNNDVGAAVQVHLLQTIHQLTDGVIELPQSWFQLKTEKTQEEKETAQLFLKQMQ